MASRYEFLRQLWDEIIDPNMEGVWIDNVIQVSRKNPNAPFSDVGPALERLLAAGADRHDLNLIARHAAYEAIFGTLYALSDPGIDNNDVEMLHESLLSAEPKH